MSARTASHSTGHEVDLFLAAELLGSAADRVCPIESPPGLHVCPGCERPFVVPGAVHAVLDAARVRLDLACVNCGWAATAVHTEQELLAFEGDMGRSFDDLLWTHEVVWTANTQAAIERFAAALAADAIVPDDF